MSASTRSRMRAKRVAGGAAIPVLFLLLVLGGALGWNYDRNCRIDREQEKKTRPFARYPTADLPVLEEGYRLELEQAQAKQGARRVQARDRYRLAEQIEEFERVQREARKARSRAVDVAEIQANIDALEAEQARRAAGPPNPALVHITRMFRL